MRIGPDPREVLGGDTVPEDLLVSFDNRGGLRLPGEQVDSALVSRLLDEDLAVVTQR